MTGVWKSENVGNDLDRLINEQEAATFLGYSVRALQNWRLRGGGPVFVKVSARSVRYRMSDLTAWVEVRLRVSTSDPGPNHQPGACPVELQATAP